MPDTKPMHYRVVNRLAVDRAGERERVIAALLGTPASISPAYFYDELGCALYGAICRLPEYYPTRTEIAIFQEHRDRKSTRLNSSHIQKSRMPSSA